MDNSKTHDQISQAYLDTFDKYPPGLLVLEHLHRLYYDTDSFSKDPYQHAYYAGQRSVVRMILQRLYLATNPPLQEDQDAT